MQRFHLVDLDTQCDAVLKAIGRRSRRDTLDWLCQHGSVHNIEHPLDSHLYGFESGVGIRTVFRLTDDGDMIIIRRHTTHRAS